MKPPAKFRRGALLTLLCSSSLTVMAGATIAPGLGLMGRSAAFLASGLALAVAGLGLWWWEGTRSA